MYHCSPFSTRQENNIGRLNFVNSSFTHAFGTQLVPQLIILTKKLKAVDNLIGSQVLQSKKCPDVLKQVVTLKY